MLKNIFIITCIIIGIGININNINCTETNTNQYLSKQSYKYAKKPKDFLTIINKEENKNMIVNLVKENKDEKTNTSVEKNIDNVIDDINSSYDNKFDFGEMDSFV